MKTGSILLGLLGALGLGGVAMAMGNKKQSPESQVSTGNGFILTYATSRVITDSDLAMIQRAMMPAMKALNYDIQGIALSAPQQFKANVSPVAGKIGVMPGVGSVGVLGSNPNDAITVQLIAADKV
jgi:hypothetical protein